MAKIKFNTNSKLKCVCGHNLRITDVGEDGIKFEKFCPQCGRTTHVDDKGTESGGEFDGIRLSYFGRFHVNPKRLKNLNHEAFQRRQFQHSD